MQGQGRNFEASNYLFSGGASDRKMSLGFYCLPDVMSWLYPISIVDIFKINKNLWFFRYFFFIIQGKVKLQIFSIFFKFMLRMGTLNVNVFFYQVHGLTKERESSYKARKSI